MRKKKIRYLWDLTGVLLIAVAAIAFYRHERTDKRCGYVVPTEADVPERGLNNTPTKKFFTRYIDTITLDTMYFVCKLNQAGDTIPDQINLTYANDSVAMCRYYLNNRGDTVLLDYYLQQDKLAPAITALPVTDSLFRNVKDSVINEDEQRLISDISGYLDRISHNVDPNTYRTVPDTTHRVVVRDTDSIPVRNTTFNSIIVPDETDE